MPYYRIAAWRVSSKCSARGVIRGGDAMGTRVLTVAQALALKPIVFASRVVVRNNNLSITLTAELIAGAFFGPRHTKPQHLCVYIYGSVFALMI